MKYNISTNGLNLIKHHEGLKLKKYLCPRGVPTIGYGHAILENEDIEQVSEEEAEKLLNLDCQIIGAQIQKYIKVPLQQHQYDSVISLAYNLGSQNFKNSTLLKKLNKRMHEEVPNEFLKWVRCKGDILPGLVKRREAEAKLYKEGIL